MELNRWRLGSPAVQHGKHYPAWSPAKPFVFAESGEIPGLGLGEGLELTKMLVEIASVGVRVVDRPAHHTLLVEDVGRPPGTPLASSKTS